MDRLIWWNGRLVPWDQAVVHVTSETALRGLNVFEGLRAYWRPLEASFAIVGIEAHLVRLFQSARSLGIPIDNSTARLAGAIAEVIQAVPVPQDLYIRPTIYVDRGGYVLDPGELSVGEFVSWRPEPARPFRTLRCCVSSWMRLPPSCLPSSAKVGAVYSAFRMARLEAISKGFDEAILLNSHGRVAETGGGSVFVVQDGKLRTPPLEEGILPSITRRIVLETLSKELGIEFEIAPLSLGDLYEADEVFVAGTLDEVAQVSAVDQAVFPTIDPGESIVRKFQAAYADLCVGGSHRESDWISLVSRGKEGG